MTTKSSNDIINEYTGLLRGKNDNLNNVLRILPLLLKGNSVSAKLIAAELGISSEEANLFLNGIRSYGGEFNEDRDFIGFGITLVPTPHKYEVNNHTFYTWCAVDTIIFPSIYNHTAVITSPDPVSGKKIRLTVNKHGIHKIEPGSAVVSFKSKDVLSENVRDTCCTYQHFFETYETASKYVSIHKNAEVDIVKPEEAFQFVSIMFDKEPLKSFIDEINDPKRKEV